ncbi:MULTISPECIES: serine/threonine-protein kinase [Nostocales]|uniref:serine/threonine-protein kinase n=1 Tax=Nostocales TaxID=1161 RepID=UPI00029B5BAD|nr:MULTISPECIES: serine/threonine-protein kinase [Nostocales]MBO1053948.1 serine/threonine protein kinase [Dolichospermum sp. DET73]AFW93626.1 putative serine/threonine protein kinase [Anabaena sp. 90]MTJ16133.1 serine/threonine protein kinase [Dolichospermum sp. UHCC 0299]MTJ22541.1 serine/threonine protein kinase [Dolichospermum sp. UHCC 0352]MTJ39965.1 serine/threonine protein kinase [Dolichospermum sp. UHCC 0406]
MMISTFTNKNLIGEILKGQNGDYKILDKLNEGGFGEIYLAEDISNQNQKCVVKLLKPKQNSNREDFEERKRLFRREAEHLNKLDHSQIPELKDYFVINYRLLLIVKQDFYLVEEYIEGEQLTKELPPTKKLDSSKVWQILYDILEILEFLQEEKNLVHRDVTPANLIRRNSDQKLVLIDFGTVKEMTDIENHPLSRVIGTYEYMPHERIDGISTYNTDVFYVGMIGIQALTGVRPDPRRYDDNSIKFEDNGQITWRHLLSESQLNEQFTQKLIGIIDKMVHNDYQKTRYNTAADALKALKSIELINSTEKIPNSSSGSISNLVISNPETNIQLFRKLFLELIPQEGEKRLNNFKNTILTIPSVYTIDITPKPDENNKVIERSLLSGKVVIIASIATALAFAFLGFQGVSSLKTAQKKPDSQETKISEIQPDISKEELTKTYNPQEPDKNFTIKYSDQWIAREETPGGSEKIKFIRKDKLQTDNCPVEILVSVDDLGKALLLEERKKEILTNIQKDDLNSLERADEKVILDKTDAYQIRWTRQENGCTFKILERGTMAFKKAYYITYQAPVGENDKFWPVVEKMIDSFHIQESN